MQRPMEGVRILEVAQWTFVPAAGGVLADWGADVIKIEHPVTGDGQRGILQTGVVKDLGMKANVFMEHPNRGKRSVGLDIDHPDGREVLYEIAKTSDVFLTNFLPEARTRLGIELEDLRRVNPDIIYVRGSAVGDKGPERLKGGYDMTGYWCRAGSAFAATPMDMDGMISQPAPGYGDSIGGMTIAGGIAGALFGRSRTGEPSVVDVSLLSTGMWSMSMAIDLSLQSGQPWQHPPMSASPAPSNPLTATYRTADGRYIAFVMLQAFRYWPDFCAHIGRPELVADERFASAQLLMENAGHAQAVIREVIAERTLAEWTDAFRTMEGQWGPVQNSVELGQDPQALANGYIVDVELDDGETFPLVANPVQFDEAPPAIRRAPEHAQHTEELLLELGYDWDRIIELKTAGAIS